MLVTPAEGPEYEMSKFGLMVSALNVCLARLLTFEHHPAVKEHFARANDTPQSGWLMSGRIVDGGGAKAHETAHFTTQRTGGTLVGLVPGKAGNWLPKLSVSNNSLRAKNSNWDLVARIIAYELEKASALLNISFQEAYVQLGKSGWC